MIKRSFVYGVAALVTLLVSVAFVFGQTTTIEMVEEGEHVRVTVHSTTGQNTVYSLVGAVSGNPENWRKIVALPGNEMFLQPGRIFTTTDRNGRKLEVARVEDGESFIIPKSMIVAGIPIKKEGKEAEVISQTPNQSTSITTAKAVGYSLGSILLLLLAFVVVACLLAARRRSRALADNPRHPEYQAEGIRRNTLGAQMGFNPPLRDHLANVDRLAGNSISGRRKELYTVVVPRGEIPTEYRDGVLTASANGQTICIAVYRDTENAITGTTGHWKFCLNGVPFEQMQPLVLTGLLNSLPETAQRVWVASDYNEEANWPDVRAWMINNLPARTEEAQAEAARAAESSVIEEPAEERILLEATPVPRATFELINGVFVIKVGNQSVRARDFAAEQVLFLADNTIEVRPRSSAKLPTGSICFSYEPGSNSRSRDFQVTKGRERMTVEGVTRLSGDIGMGDRVSYTIPPPPPRRALPSSTAAEGITETSTEGPIN